MNETILRYWALLGIPSQLVAERGLPYYEEASVLELAELPVGGRRYELEPNAAIAWKVMKAAAEADYVSIRIVSAYRSIERQAELILNKLKTGQRIEEILAVSAPPGCSEHHTGRAVDIGTMGAVPLATEFEKTPAFDWLRCHATEYGFALSFPKNNRWGYAYEPWHWCFVAPQFKEASPRLT